MGHTAKAIARWDVVPYQTFSGDINIGVVAFDIAGIDHVDFSLNGGAWTPVTQMQLNPDTGVWEYTATVHAGDVPDGPIEVRAIAVPMSGVPRVLQNASGASLGDKSLVLFANSHGTLTNSNRSVYVSPSGNDTTADGTQPKPYSSIATAISRLVSQFGACEGATIYLLPGTYSYPDMGGTQGADTRWLTLQGAPGTSRSQVILTNSANGPTQKKLHIKELRLQQTTNAQILGPRSDPFGNHFWIDHCDMVGLGYIGATTSNVPMVTVSQAVETWYTDINMSNTAACGFGTWIEIIRNVTATNIGSDFLNSERLMVNVSVDHMRFNSGVHPDILQVPIGAIENLIVFNLKATDAAAQGFNLGDNAYPMSNVAIVNALLVKAVGDPQYTYLGQGSSTDHLLMWQITTVGWPWNWSVYPRTNLSIRNCVVDSKNATNPANFPGIIDNLHFSDGLNPIGTNFTLGNPGFTDAANGDYHPLPNSPLVNRVVTMPVPVTLDQVAIPTGTVGAIGAYQKH